MWKLVQEGIYWEPVPTILEQPATCSLRTMEVGDRAQPESRSLITGDAGMWLCVWGHRLRKLRSCLCWGARAREARVLEWRDGNSRACGSKLEQKANHPSSCCSSVPQSLWDRLVWPTWPQAAFPQSGAEANFKPWPHQAANRTAATKARGEEGS